MVCILTVTDPETETDKMGKELNGNLCWHLSLCSVNTTTQFYINYFLSVSVSGSLNTTTLQTLFLLVLIIITIN